MKIRLSVCLLTCIFSMSTLALAEKKVYLSLDAGAMFGFLTAKVIQDIEKQTGKPLYQSIDGIIGTSTGAIVAALATLPASNKKDGSPYTGEEIAQFYRTQGGTIFGSVISAVTARTFGMKPQVEPADVLQNELGQVFLNKDLSDALIPLRILSYDQTQKQPYVFDSIQAKEDKNMNTSIASAVLASASVNQIYGLFGLIKAFGEASVEFHGGSKRQFVDIGSPNTPGQSFNPTQHLYSQLNQQNSNQDEIILISIGNGYSLGNQVTQDINSKIKVIRLEPNVSVLFPPNGVRNQLSLDLYSANATPSFLSQLEQVALELKNNPNSGYDLLIKEVTERSKVLGK